MLEGYLPICSGPFVWTSQVALAAFSMNVLINDNEYDFSNFRAVACMLVRCDLCLGLFVGFQIVGGVDILRLR